MNGSHKRNAQSPKTRLFMSLHYISSSNSKNTNYRHISLTGTDHCNSKLSKNTQFKKGKLLPFLIFKKIYKKIKVVIFLKDCVFP